MKSKITLIYKTKKLDFQSNWGSSFGKTKNCINSPCNSTYLIKNVWFLSLEYFFNEVFRGSIKQKCLTLFNVKLL